MHLRSNKNAANKKRKIALPRFSVDIINKKKTTTDLQNKNFHEELPIWHSVCCKCNQSIFWCFEYKTMTNNFCNC